MLSWLAAVHPRPTRGPDRAARERAGSPPGMVYVRGGECVLGSDDPDADEDVRPARHATIPPFYIDRTEVTNEEFRRFRAGRPFPPGEEQLPVTNVTYTEAESYARWAGKRLPTDEEWEKAARGVDGRRYPWGNQWDKQRVTSRAGRDKVGQPRTAPPAKGCGIGPSRVRPVGTLASGASPYGCLDMAGNAWEWVQGYYHGHPDQRILRGGAVGYGERACRTYQRAIEGSGAT
jgi:formylglycine-generating enzyme required for sulfatase activity